MGEGLWRWGSGFGVRRGLFLPRLWSLVWPYVTEARLASAHDQASILADATQRGFAYFKRAASAATARPKKMLHISPLVWPGLPDCSASTTVDSAPKP